MKPQPIGYQPVTNNLEKTSMFEFEITELYRRLSNVVKLGRVAAIDYSGAIPRVRVRIAPLTTAWLPLMSLRAGPDKSWWPVEIDEQVVVLSPTGELNQGVVLGAISQQQFPAAGDSINEHRMTYADGAVIEYDRASHHLSATLPSGATTTLISDGGVSIEGDVTITGNLTVSDNATVQGEATIASNATVGGVTTTAGLATAFISTTGVSARNTSAQSTLVIDDNVRVLGDLSVTGDIDENAP